MQGVVVSDIHIDDFYKDAAKILVLLYNHFPRRVTLYVEDISGPDKPDEFGLHNPRYEACFHTMLWLASTGYIEYSQPVQQDALDQACLTHRAFLLLNSAMEEPDMEGSGEAPPDVPPVLVGLETLAINRLRKELTDGTSYSLADLMKRLMNSARQFS